MDRMDTGPFDDWCVDEWRNSSSSSNMDSSQSQKNNPNPLNSQSSVPGRRSIGSRSSSLEEGEIEDDDDDPLFEGTVPLLSSSPKQLEAPKVPVSWSPVKPKSSETSGTRSKDSISYWSKTSSSSSSSRSDYSLSRKSSRDSPGKREKSSGERSDGKSSSWNERTSSDRNSSHSHRRSSSSSQRRSDSSSSKKHSSSPPKSSSSSSRSHASSSGRSKDDEPEQKETLSEKIVISPKKVQPSRPTGVEKSIKLVLSKSSISHKKDDASQSKERKSSSTLCITDKRPTLEDGEIVDSQQKDTMPRKVSSPDEEHNNVPLFEKKAVDQAVMHVLEKEKRSTLNPEKTSDLLAN